MDQKFAKGTVVRLKSGGPTMTVVDLGEYDFKTDVYLCRWFDAKNEPKSETFGEAEIESIDPRATATHSVPLTRG